MINPVFAIISISTLLSQLNSLTNIASALLLAVIGAGTWLGQKYFSFITDTWIKKSNANETAQAILADIQTTRTNYVATFTNESFERSKNAITEMHRLRKLRPLLMASTSDNYIYELVRKDFSRLPSNVLKPIIAFYTSDQLFDSCYKLLGSQEFAKSPKSVMIKSLQENYDACKETIKFADAAILAIGKSACRFTWWKIFIVIGNLIGLGCLWKIITVQFSF